MWGSAAQGDVKKTGGHEKKNYTSVMLSGVAPRGKATKTFFSKKPVRVRSHQNHESSSKIRNHTAGWVRLPACLVAVGFFLKDKHVFQNTFVGQSPL